MMSDQEEEEFLKWIESVKAWKPKYKHKKSKRFIRPSRVPALETIFEEEEEEEEEEEVEEVEEVEEAESSEDKESCKRKWWQKCFDRKNSKVRNIKKEHDKKGSRIPKLLRVILCCFTSTAAE
ncbi:uncharacterized protein LOC143781412 [Ranitomeya variabilis]|uniref:uncharacterized protein LOC143781412 n=1 Tax=Ranitomeya variabilis TaxID=490064 RepID=UPI004057CB12